MGGLSAVQVLNAILLALRILGEFRVKCNINSFCTSYAPFIATSLTICLSLFP